MNLDPQRDEQKGAKQEKEFRKNLSVPTLMAVPFLALNHYDGLFMLVYLVIAISLLAYKNSAYPLPGYALACEGVVLVMLALTQALRYRFASMTISDKQAHYAVIYIVGSVFVLLSFIFELRLQTYVILAEIVSNWVGISLAILEVLCAIWIIVVLKHKNRNQ